MIWMIKRADGGISLRVPGVMSREDFFESWKASASLRDARLAGIEPPWLPATIEEFHGEIPTKDEFRNAWECCDGKIEANLTKAQELTKERLRREREPKMRDLDAEYMRALEIADLDLQAKIAEQKQELRDVTDKCDTATCLDELKAIQVP